MKYSVSIVNAAPLYFLCCIVWLGMSQVIKAVSTILVARRFAGEPGDLISADGFLCVFLVLNI